MEIMIYLGTMWGTFQDRDSGREVHYCKVFLVDSIPEGQNINGRGYRGQGYSLTDPELTKELKPFQKIKVYFNRRGAVSGVELIDDEAVTA